MKKILTLTLILFAAGLAGSVLAATSLTAEISANPMTGTAPLNGVDLIARVTGGDAAGPITYRFDCTSDGFWDRTETSNNTSFTAVGLCNYSSAGNYIASVRIDRENLSFEGKVAIIATSTTTVPTVDLKINGFDGTISLDSGAIATLSWTSSNATSCSASGNWSGSKGLSGSESTGNLYSGHSYTISCSGAGGTATDSVAVNVSQPQTQTLFVSLEAIPNSGTAPLNNVALRATVSGTAMGLINYHFDCTSDGVWDYNFSSLTDNPKTVLNACNYPNAGTYTAKVLVERGGLTAQALALVNVSAAFVGGPDVSLVKTARNLSDGTDFMNPLPANPGELLEFKIVIASVGSSSADSVTIKDTLPDRLTLSGQPKIDGQPVTGDIQAGLNIGSLAPGQTRTVTFQALLAGAASFNFGTTSLVNTVLAYNVNLARTQSSTIQVSRTQVKGATTVTTGVLDNFKFSLLLSLLLTALLTYFLLLRFYLSHAFSGWGAGQALERAGRRLKRFLPRDSSIKSREKLIKIAETIRQKEQL